jgi:hypothetical protein
MTTVASHFHSTLIIIFFRSFPEGCSRETMVEIEVWDYDFARFDEKIGSVQVSLGALERKIPVDLVPVASGQILIVSANFKAEVYDSRRVPTI